MLCHYIDVMEIIIRNFIYIDIFQTSLQSTSQKRTRERQTADKNNTDEETAVKKKTK